MSDNKVVIKNLPELVKFIDAALVNIEKDILESKSILEEFQDSFTGNVFFGLKYRKLTENEINGFVPVQDRSYYKNIKSKFKHIKKVCEYNENELIDNIILSTNDFENIMRWKDSSVTYSRWVLDEFLTYAQRIFCSFTYIEAKEIFDKRGYVW